MVIHHIRYDMATSHLAFVIAILNALLLLDGLYAKKDTIGSGRTRKHKTKKS
jgi:hypothetical protein